MAGASTGALITDTRELDAGGVPLPPAELRETGEKPARPAGGRRPTGPSRPGGPGKPRGGRS